MPRLLVIKGADEGKHFEMTEDRLGIGRDTQNLIRLHDTEASRKHAEFVETDKGYTLRDLQSANGTFVNNQRVAGEVLLGPSDRIQIGQTVLVYSAGPGEAPARHNDLAGQINMISRNDLELSSAIIRKVAESEGSQILAHPENAKTPWLKTALANLRILYQSSHAISRILDLDELLSRILQLVFESITADRGCIMVKNAETEQIEPQALHWRNPAEKQQKMAVSSTIIDHVLAKKEGVLVSNAAQDDRFNTGQSIVQHGIREVICVPMRGRHETIGVLYLDTRVDVRKLAEQDTSLGKFNDGHLELAIAIAHQAALAVEETRYHQALVQAERLAAIGQTIAKLSHHIKNILQGLRWGNDILKMGLNEKKEDLLHEGWRVVERNQGKIYDLVMDMLSYSKDREPAIEETDLNELAREVYELLKGRAAEKDIKLEIDLEDRLPLVDADSAGINHALLNIAGNALDAVEEQTSPQVIIGSRLDPQPGWVRLVVLDNGPGISPEKRDDIFKPFVSSKGSKGTGLGLPVSRKILREHHGDLIVESQVGKGTRFTLRLPIKSPLNMELTGLTMEGTIVSPPDDE